jgi:hypothetical protein
METNMSKKKYVLLCSLVALNFATSYPGSAAPAPTDDSTAEQSKDDPLAAMALSDPTKENIEALAKAIEQNPKDMLSRKAMEMLADYGNTYARREVYRLGIWEDPKTTSEEYICNSFEDYLTSKGDIEKYNQTVVVGTKLDFNKSTEDEAVKQLKFPVMYERIGPMIDKEELNYSPRWRELIGWTISIAPRFSSFNKVLEEVQELHRELLQKQAPFSYIYAANAETIRKRYYAQQPLKGSIELFFLNNRHAAYSVKALDTAFKKKGLSRKDFLYIDGYFQVGETGGLYVKLFDNRGSPAFYGKEGDDNKVIIKKSIFNNYVLAYDGNTNTCTHPFDNLKNRGVVVPKKISDIIGNTEYNGIIPCIADISESTKMKEVGADNDALLNQDLLKTTLETPTKENVYKLANAIKLDNGEVKTINNAARIILEALGDDGNIAAIEKLYELGIWTPSYVNFDWKSKLAVSKKLEWSSGNPEKHNFYSINKTLDNGFDVFIDSFYKEHSSLKTSMYDPYLKNPRKNPMRNPSVSPCAIEYTGNMRHPYIHFFYLMTDKHKSSLGWKMHISARISSAKKIAKIVLPYLEKQKIHYKIIVSTPTLRLFYNTARYGQIGGGLLAPFSQRGKFITIYTESDEEANKIAVYLDNAFKAAKLTREDFVYINGDLQVGDSGGIYTRLTCYDQDFDTERGHLNIGPKTLLTYLEGIYTGQQPSIDTTQIPEFSERIRHIDSRGFPIYRGRDYRETQAAVEELARKLEKPEILNHEHPFSLELKHRGLEMPKKILDIIQFIGNEPDIEAFRDYVYQSK